jgi:NAD(P)-dependent dehydrogenase (short-subunit alcohol dehydrogenase family)
LTDRHQRRLSDSNNYVTRGHLPAQNPGRPVRELPAYDRRGDRLNQGHRDRRRADRKPGNVINIPSQTGDRPTGGRGLYGLSNTAINGLTWRMAWEYAQHGIRVNAISTDATETFEIRKDARIYGEKYYERRGGAQRVGLVSSDRSARATPRHYRRGPLPCQRSRGVRRRHHPPCQRRRQSARATGPQRVKGTVIQPNSFI